MKKIHFMVTKVILSLLILSFGCMFMFVVFSGTASADGNYQVWTAWGAEEKTSYYQFKINGVSSGCAANAWMNLIGWYDLHFNPSLISGRRLRNDSVIDNMMRNIVSTLGTKKLRGQGLTWPRNMERVRNYIWSNLKHRANSMKGVWKTNADVCGMGGDKKNLIKLVGESIKKGYPCIVGINTGKDALSLHYCIAYKFEQNLRNRYDEDSNYIYVDLLLRTRRNQKISFERVWGAWSMHHLEPMNNKRTYKDYCTHFTPALVKGPDRFVIAWRGTDSRGKLNFMVSSFSSSIHFAKSRNQYDTSLYRPALVFFNEKYYVLYVLSNRYKHLYMMESSDGYSWRNKRSISEPLEPMKKSKIYSSITGPAAVVFKNKLYCAFIDHNHRINVISTSDGKSWRNHVILTHTSRYSPALATWNDNLLLAWTGMDSQGHLNAMYSRDGQNFNSQFTLQETSDSEPALCTRANQAPYIAWQGKDNRRINYMQFNNEFTQFKIRKIVLSDTSKGAPAIASTGNKLLIAWTGTDASGCINVRKEDFE